MSVNNHYGELPKLVNYIMTSTTSFTAVTTSFKTGELDDISTDGDEIYPQFFLEQPFQGVYSPPNGITWKLAMIVNSQELRERTDELDKQSLCFDLMNIFLQKIRKDSRETGYSLIDSSINFTSLDQFTTNVTAGFRVEFDLMMPIPVSKCLTPADYFYSSSTYSNAIVSPIPGATINNYYTTGNSYIFSGDSNITITTGGTTPQEVNVSLNPNITIDVLTVNSTIQTQQIAAEDLFANNNLYANSIFLEGVNITRLLGNDASAFRIKNESADRWHSAARNITYNASTLTADRIYLACFPVPKDITIDNISYYVNKSAPNSAIRLGIYGSDSNNLPSNLIVDAGSAITTSDSTIITKNINTLLTGNSLYWLACVDNGPVEGFGHLATAVYGDIMGSTGNFGIAPSHIYQSTAGVPGLPSTLTSLQYGTGVVPMVMFRIA